MTAFNDSEIVKLLSEKFIPIASTVGDAKRQDTDGEFFRKVIKPIPYRQSGACVFTAEGTVLAAGFATSKREVLQLIESALPKFKPSEKPQVVESAGTVDEKNSMPVKPQEGGLVVNCIMTNLSEQGSGASDYGGGHQWLDKQVPYTVGVDRLWVRKDEAAALAGGKFPESLKRRVAHWHLIDNRNFGQNEDAWVKRFDLQLAGGRLTGSVRIESGKGYAMKLDVLGFIESRGGRITRFDLVARGTRRVGESGEYPVAFAFTRADAAHVASKVPPYPVLAHGKSLYLRD